MALEKWFYDELDGKQSIDEHLLFILQNSTSVAFAGLLSAVGCKKPPLFDGPLQPLLGVAEFHLWELEYSVEHQYLWSGVWWNQPEWLIRLAQEWHKLPHRERNLRDLAPHFFLNIPQIRPFFEKARSSWIKQLENVENDNRLKEHLEQLIAVYDIDKWQTQLHQDHGNIWAFEETKQECEKRESELQKIGNVRYLIAFPTQCRQILDENKPIEEERLEEFWGTLRNIAKQKSQDITKQDIACVESAVCGGLAVLFQLHRDWLRKYPAREKWCLKQLIKIIQNPPRKEGPYLEYDKCTWTWDSFCAQIIPILWAENPEDGEFRCYAASFASHPRYQTVELLFASAFKFRMQLKDHFKQLQHFTLRWAALREQLLLARNQVSQDENKIRRKVRKKWRREANAFANGKTPVAIPKWKEIAAKNRQRDTISIEHGGKELRPYSGLDELLLQSMYSWLPTLDQAANENERKELDTWGRSWRRYRNRRDSISLGLLGARQNFVNNSATERYRRTRMFLETNSQTWVTVSLLGQPFFGRLVYIQP
jgi:hypothetical protein